MNVEKKFLEKIKEDYDECGVEVIYKLMESDVINTEDMKKYLIKAEFKEIISKGNVQKMIVYSDLAEKFHTSIAKVRYCLL